MPDWKTLLATHGPKLALGLIASHQGGPQSAAAFMQGLEEREQQTAQGQRQAQLDAQAQEDRAFTRSNAEAATARQTQDSEWRRFQEALRLIEGTKQQQAEFATDPVQAENAVMRQATSVAQAAGLPPDKLTGAVSGMPALMSGKKKKQAQDIYERAEKTYGAEAMATDALTIQTPFGDLKPSQLRAMFEAPAVDASGAPVRPKLPPTPTQIIDRGGMKQVVDPTALVPGQTFPDVAGPASGAADRTKFWVVRDGKPLRVTEAEYRPGDLPASTREQGRPVTSGDAGRVAELDTSLDDLDVLKTTIQGIPGATGTSARIGAALWNPITEFTGWGADAKSKQAVIDRVKQVIGKVLEGGVLRKEDEYKYVKILPTIGDVADVVATKLEGLERAILQQRERTVEALTDAGFDTKNFTERTPRKTATGPAIGERRLINGQLGEWDGKGWKAAQ